MRPTRWPVLVLVALVAGGIAYLVTRSAYNDLPSPKVYALVWIALLAAVELYVGLMTRARLAGRSGTRAINPIAVARLAALAKASSLVGAVLAGGYAGFFAWVVRRPSPVAAHDSRASASGAGFSLLLVAAALFLEHVCRVKDDDRSDRHEERPRLPESHR